MNDLVEGLRQQASELENKNRDLQRDLDEIQDFVFSLQSRQPVITTLARARSCQRINSKEQTGTS